jgi:hypothetical protein
LASHLWEISVMHHERHSRVSSRESGSFLVIADFEYSDDGELFYLTTAVCHVRRHLAARTGCRGGVAG